MKKFEDEEKRKIFYVVNLMLDTRKYLVENYGYSNFIADAMVWNSETLNDLLDGLISEDMQKSHYIAMDIVEWYDKNDFAQKQLLKYWCKIEPEEMK